MRKERKTSDEIKGIDRTMMEVLALMWVWGAFCGLALGYFIF